MYLLIFGIVDVVCNKNHNFKWCFERRGVVY